MDKLVTGCADCPLCEMNDLSPGYLFRAARIKIKEDKYRDPVTPDFCPLKSSPITINLKEE